MKKPETNNGNTGRRERECIELRDFSVSGARVWDNGRITFNLCLNGVTIYGCRVVEGKEGDFISYPSRKGNDGKYYSYAYAALKEDDVNAILGEVERQINA